jgi:hypothetical protein
MICFAEGALMNAAIFSRASSYIASLLRQAYARRDGCSRSSGDNNHSSLRSLESGFCEVAVESKYTSGTLSCVFALEDGKIFADFVYVERHGKSKYANR